MADRAQIDQLGMHSAGDAPNDATVDARIADMRRLLEQMTEPSTTEALRVLRDNFPDAPLDERVRAMKFSRH